MKKNYKTPTNKVHQINVNTMLAESYPGFQNGTVNTGDVKQELFDLEDQGVYVGE